MSEGSCQVSEVCRSPLTVDTFYLDHAIAMSDVVMPSSIVRGPSLCPFGATLKYGSHIS